MDRMKQSVIDKIKGDDINPFRTVDMYRTMALFIQNAELNLHIKITKYVYDTPTDNYIRRVLNNMIFRCFHDQISLVDMFKTNQHLKVLKETKLADRNYHQNFHSGMINIINKERYVERYNEICQLLKRGPIELDIQKNIVYEMIMLEIKDDVKIVEDMLDNMFSENNVNYYKKIEKLADYAPIVNLAVLGVLIYGIYKVCSIFDLR